MDENAQSDGPVVIDAQDGQVCEIEMDKNYIIVLTFPPDADARHADETCKHLAGLLATWVESDYPNKFFVIGLRNSGMKLAFHSRVRHGQTDPVVPQMR